MVVPLTKKQRADNIEFLKDDKRLICKKLHISHTQPVFDKSKRLSHVIKQNKIILLAITIVH
jgi:hypothetical protein